MLLTFGQFLLEYQFGIFFLFFFTPFQMPLKPRFNRMVALN